MCWFAQRSQMECILARISRKCDWANEHWARTAMKSGFEIVQLHSQHVMTVRMDIDPTAIAKTLGEIFGEVCRYIADAGSSPAGPPFSRSEMTPGGLLGMEAGLPVARAASRPWSDSAERVAGRRCRQGYSPGSLCGNSQYAKRSAPLDARSGPRTRWASLGILCDRPGRPAQSGAMAIRDLLAIATELLRTSPLSSLPFFVSASSRSPR